jgi:hypothetical protein
MSILSKRATVYLDPLIHKALRLKAVETSLSISQLIDNALRTDLFDDAEDLEAFENRIGEPSIEYNTFVQELKQDGLL